MAVDGAGRSHELLAQVSRGMRVVGLSVRSRFAGIPSQSL